MSMDMAKTAFVMPTKAEASLINLDKTKAVFAHLILASTL